MTPSVEERPFLMTVSISTEECLPSGSMSRDGLLRRLECPSLFRSGLEGEAVTAGLLYARTGALRLASGPFSAIATQLNTANRAFI
jgi:hypothetical protein